MIREIINFTKGVLEEYPEVMQWNVTPNGGLYVFVHLDEHGKWDSNNLVYGKDYFYIGKNYNIDNCVELAKKYEGQVKRVGTSMNKVLDVKKKIFSCSPFAVIFKKKSLSDEKLEGKGVYKIVKILPSYFNSARLLCEDDEVKSQLSKRFENVCEYVLNFLLNLRIPFAEKSTSIIEEMKDNEYVNIFLENISFNSYVEVHNKYLRDRLFNTNDYNKEISGEIYGLSGFLNGMNSKKMFLSHKTGLMCNGINGRITFEDALFLSQFETLIINGTLPNPLPIVIDKNEINGRIVSIFNRNEKKRYRDIIKELFDGKYVQNLSDYYLLNYSKKKSIVINDIDFVPLFRYYFVPLINIYNVFEVGKKKEDDSFVCEPDIVLSNVFDFERIVLKEIFNNALIVENDKGIIVRYFDEIDPRYVKGGDLMYQLILKYRKAFYDYIHKSELNVLNQVIFDEIMFVSILSNIRTDEVKSLFYLNYPIRKKMNIWFSLCEMFNNSNNINSKVMISKVSELLKKMVSVSRGESIIETPEEFAFAAGQLVSYLIDRSVASNKTYSMLEPYLQKTKSGHLQDAIANTVSIYKHDISTYKGAFQQLASNVLTCDENLDMKPLLKYFLAGCFSKCVIYIKNDND